MLYKPMIPDRLDQLESLMVDVLQKIDELIEEQSELLDMALQPDQSSETPPKSGTNLITSTQRQLGNIKASQKILCADLKRVKISQASLQAGQDLILEILRENFPNHIS
jgi:hypothetical protein